MFRFESLAFLWLRSVYGGSCRIMSLTRCCKKSWLSFGFAVSEGEAAEIFLFLSVTGSCDVVSSGRWTLCDIPCVSEVMSVHDRRGRKVAVSRGEAGQSYLFSGFKKS